MRDDYYFRLRIHRDATPLQVKSAYRKRAKETHPDTPSGDRAEFMQVQEAYEVLSDDIRRARYDAQRQQAIEEQGLVACPTCFAAVRVPAVIPEGKVPFCKDCQTPLPVRSKRRRTAKPLSPIAERALQVADEIGVEVTELAGEAILRGLRKLRTKVKG